MAGITFRQASRPLLAIILLCYACGSYFAETAIGGDWANWNHGFGGLLLAAYFRLYFRDHRAAFLSSFYQMFAWLGLLGSSAIISSGWYMLEIDADGTQNGIFWVLVAFIVVGVEFTILGFKAGKQVAEGEPALRLPWAQAKPFTIAITLCVLAICSFAFIRFGSPVLLGIDRVTFWRENVPSSFGFIPNLVQQTYFFVAFYFLWSRKSRSGWLMPILIVAGYIGATYFVLGQKFSAFVLFLNAWMITIAGVYPKYKVKLVHIQIGLAAVALLIVSVVTAYVTAGREAAFVFDRIALQTQLLWALFDQPSQIGTYPISCYFGCYEYPDGQWLITYMFVPPGRAFAYEGMGNSLSGFVPALPILIFGFPVALALNAFISLIFGFIQQKLVRAISRKDFIYSAMLFKLHFGFAIFAITASPAPINGMIVMLVLIVVYRIMLAAVALPPACHRAAFRSRSG